jgi:hypothetical protein
VKGSKHIASYLDFNKDYNCTGPKRFLDSLYTLEWGKTGCQYWVLTVDIRFGVFREVFKNIHVFWDMTLYRLVTVHTFYSHNWVLVNTKFSSIIRGWIKKHLQDLHMRGDSSVLGCYDAKNTPPLCTVSSIKILPWSYRYSKLALWPTYIFPMSGTTLQATDYQVERLQQVL